MAGYHVNEIPKGELGKLSKIQEELDELSDAEQQGVKILMLCELCDIVGAVEAYLKANFPGFGLHDLHQMAKLTAEAFKVGQR
jgi:hypothetical protein